MSYGSGGSYARAKLAIDITKDEAAKDRAIRQAQKARDDENAVKGILNLVGTAVGYYFGGQAGATIGKNVTGEVYDFFDTSGEFMPDIDTKFNRHEWEMVLEDLDKYDKSTSFGGLDWTTKFAGDLWDVYMYDKTKKLYETPELNPTTGYGRENV